MDKKIFTIEDSALHMQSTAVFTPKHPEHGRLESLSITFNSPTSPEYQNQRNKIEANIISKTVTAKAKDIDDENPITAKDVDESTQTEMNTIAQMVVSWGDGYTKEGKPLEANQKNALAVFSDPKTSWIFRQASAWFRNEKHFFLSGSKD